MNLAKIPSLLKQHAQWLLWNAENNTKVPYQTNGRKASKTNPEEWNTFDAAVKASDRFAGIGFVFTADDPFVGIDLDGCRDADTGVVDSWAADIIRRIGSYAEASPSGTGVKIFAIGQNPFESGKNFSLSLPNKYGKRPGIEIYDRGAYFCVTGMRLAGMQELVEVDSNLIRELVEALPIRKPFKTNPTVEPKQSTTATTIERARRYVAMIEPAVSGQHGHNQTFYVACVLVLGFELRTVDAYDVLAEFNERCQPPWTEKELWHKLRSADKQAGERGYLRDANDDDWSNVVVPKYHEDGKQLKPVAKPVVLEPLRDQVNQFIESITEETLCTRYSTGLKALDERLQGGLTLGSHVVFGARNGECKTMFGLQLSYALALQGLTSLIFSEEMTRDKIAKRVIQFASDVPVSEWHNEKSLIRKDTDTHFDTRAGMYVIYRAKHVTNVIETIKRARDEHGIQVVLVDYLQRLEAPGKDLFTVVSNASTALADIAHETGVLMICLCQVGRESARYTKQKTFGKEQSKIAIADHIPTKSDLKQSGRIEEDADVVLMGFRVKAVIANHPYPNDYMIRVEKNRDDQENREPIGCVFDGSRCRIRERTDLKQTAAAQRFTEFDDFNNEEF